jgi:tetratricopeptide (TPR) repeat protein
MSGPSISERKVRYTKLDRYYQQFLNDEDRARFIQQVSESYTMETLEYLARLGRRLTRRAAVLAVGFLGDFEQNETMGRGLVDSDRAVRMLADHNIRQIWLRQGTGGQRVLISRLEWLNSVSQYDQVVAEATELIRCDDRLGEAWNQRAIAFCNQRDYQLAIDDCRTTLAINPFHFPAAIGMGHCCLQLDDPVSALDCFRLAFTINPDLENLRGQICHLEQILEGR